MSRHPSFIYHRPSGVARPLEGCELIHPKIKPEIIEGFPALHVDDTLIPGESLDSLLMEKVLMENYIQQVDQAAPSNRSKIRFTVEVDLSYNVRIVDSETFDG
jgi:hypothetical protein